MYKKLLFILFFITSVQFFYAQPDTIKQKQKIIAAVPIIGYNQTFGFQIGANVMYFLTINKSDTISPASTINLIGFYTGNKSWAGVVSQRLFLQQDNWRILWALGFAAIKSQFYTEEIPGMDGTFIDFNTITDIAYLGISRRVYDRFYAGLDFSYRKLNTELYLEPISGENSDSLKKLVSIGIPLNYDSRDNVLNATRGLSVKLHTVISQKSLGSDLDFNTLTFNLNYYKRLSSKGVLATRITAYNGLGDVPFEGQKAVGGKDIRGYSDGKFRGSQVYTAQTEYRHSFKNKLGYVVFIGVAAAENTLDNSGWSRLLPGGGAGLRYMLIPDRRVNIGIDGALGKDSWGLYFRIAEAF